MANYNQGPNGRRQAPRQNSGNGGRKAQKEQRRRDYENEYDDSAAAHKAGKGCLIAFLIILVVLVAVLLTGFFYVKGELDGNNASAESTVSIEVPPGSGGQAVAGILKEAGLIGNEGIFRFYVRFNGASNGFQVGTYELEPGMSYDELIDALSQPPAPKATTQVMIPPGSTVEQFAARMEEAGLCLASDFVAEANNLENFKDLTFVQKLLEDTTDVENIYMPGEGYLAPNTYDFFTEDTVHNYVRKLYEQFDREITEEMYARMEEQGLTLRQTITLASLIEEEASVADENQGLVAGVYWNRLTKDLPSGAAGRRLECDATLLYIRDWIARAYGGDENAVPENLRYAYNTYDREGLPTGPISSPSATAIAAALYPVVHDDFYYFVDPTGEYHYNKTFAQHQADINRYGVKGRDEDE